MLRKSVENSRGNAMIEIVPILAIFVLLINFALGFFGIIHSGILNSIGARNYTFETLRNRADVSYLRDTTDQGSENLDFTYKLSGQRFHVVKNEQDFTRKHTNARSVSEAFWATRRGIKFSDIAVVEDERHDDDGTYHQTVKGIEEGKRASEKGIDEGVNPAWVRTAYGICLSAKCGG